MSMSKIVYRSRIDWWVWAALVFVLAITVIPSLFDGPWIAGIIIGLGIAVLYIVLLFGCWYEVEDDDLVVYQFFRPHRFPISKIREVKKTSGYLATAGMSHLRVSIYFTDRAVLKSSAPLEISPNDRDGFIAQLKSINPKIM